MNNAERAYQFLSSSSLYSTPLIIPKACQINELFVDILGQALFVATCVRPFKPRLGMFE